MPPADSTSSPRPPVRGTSSPRGDAGQDADAARAEAEADTGADTDTDATAPSWYAWSRWRRWLVPAFGIAVVALLLSHARDVDWSGAWRALQRYPVGLLLAVLAVASASHALYGSFDLLGRRLTQHRLPAWRSWAIAVTSYAFNLNLGALVGGLALRVRLYLRAGLKQATIAQVIGISLATNWLGYGLLAGLLFASGAISPPPQAHMAVATLRWLGGLMLVLAGGYVVAAFWLGGRELHVRGHVLRLPGGRLALVQLGMSACNWALMGAAMYLLLGREVPYTTTLAVLMTASIVGVITPIPAGLGVLEGVYLALLSGSMPQGRLLGAVLAYRALYYLLPLAGGVVMYLLLERGAGKGSTPPQPDAQPRVAAA